MVMTISLGTILTTAPMIMEAIMIMEEIKIVVAPMIMVIMTAPEIKQIPMTTIATKIGTEKTTHMIMITITETGIDTTPTDLTLIHMPDLSQAPI